MKGNFIQKISEELKLSNHQVRSTIDLLGQGSTVPFIARYRKEATDNLDEVAITNIRDRIAQLEELEKRKAAIVQSIKEQGKLTEELKAKILATETMTILEDIYLPYRPKRRTRATMAREKGLEPLAVLIFEQKGIDPYEEARNYLNAEKKVETIEDALAGARDIIAEWVNEDANIRAKLRGLYHEKGMFKSRVIRGKEAEGVKYKDYFDWQELAQNTPSHRILATRRGEKETFLMVSIQVPGEDVFIIMKNHFVKGNKPDSQQVIEAVEDSFKRLLSLSLENEYRLELKKRADIDAIDIFKNNLRQLLMAPAIGQKRIMAVDPGIRTGSKIVCLDAQGKLLYHDAVFLMSSDHQKEEAAEVIKNLCQKFDIEVIAIGNGTGSRETESFIRGLGLSKNIYIVMVNESGASIYSASEAARDEFPDHDVTVRGAVSIGRRLMDPLAELVKIDPKSIGVGQYQHDVDQNLLKNSLDDAVISCVNLVGVEVNTASKELLTYVSGIGLSRAQALIDYRNKYGSVLSREKLKDVSGFGAKAFEQAAGFLRIHDAENPLDSSAVHPESYAIVDQMARDSGCTVRDLMKNDALRKKVNLKKYITESAGLPTLKDIYEELARPGRDPREPFQLFTYKEGINTIEDLKPGLMLPGVVTNITAFGVFVDIGVHNDGLVHISQLSDRFIKDPHEIVKVHQKVMVTIMEIDIDRKRIALSMKVKAKG